jgi:hypothetical protein
MDLIETNARIVRGVAENVAEALARRPSSSSCRTRSTR